MCEAASELYVQLQPLTAADQRCLTKGRQMPLQRLKVSHLTTLATLAAHIQRLGSNEQSAPVSLYAPYRADAVQLPLSMSVAELCFIANQRGQADIRYSFQGRRGPPPPTDLHQPPKLRGRKILCEGPTLVKYPPPSPARPSVFSPGMRAAARPRFSLFSDSFGYPPSQESAPTAVRWEAAQAPAEEPLSLRKELQAIVLA
jgi:hypothetical protein